MKDAVFMGLTFQNFADINSVGTILLFIVNVLFIAFYFCKRDLFNKFIFNKLVYRHLVITSSTLLACGIVAANIYEVVYGDLPCILCWYQRALIYPMFIILVAELFFKTRVVHKFLSVLAGLTLLVASYHYYFHYVRYVLGDTMSSPCSSNPLMPNCSEAGVISYGFMTMPLMSVVMAIAVLSLAALMYNKNLK